jgi:hypothetical protein
VGTNNLLPETTFKTLFDTTLSAPAATVSTGVLPVKDYYKLIWLLKNISLGGAPTYIRFNSDAGANYTHRYSLNGAADVVAAAQNQGLICHTAAAALTALAVVDIQNLSGVNKAFIGQNIYYNTNLMGNPNRSEESGTWDNHSDVINEILLLTTGANTFGTGSRLIVLGW